MLVLGLKGSPRKKGNSDYLLSLFLEKAVKEGCDTVSVRASEKRYEPCIGCGFCEKKGVCSIKDSLETELFPLIRKADLIVLSAPVYFFGVPAWIKGMIDRTQTLWSRKYRFGLKDPGSSIRKGILLSTGGSHAKQLFDGIRLTADYFFDAAGAVPSGFLCYSGIDARGDMQQHPGVVNDVNTLVEEVLAPFKRRKRLLVVPGPDGVHGRITAAFLRNSSGISFDVTLAASDTAIPENNLAEQVMAEKGIDIAFVKPELLDKAGMNDNYDIVVFLSGNEKIPLMGDPRVFHWNLPGVNTASLEEIRLLRDRIEGKVMAFLSTWNKASR